MCLKKDSRHAAKKLDPDFRSMEAIGRLDNERQCVANEVTRKVAVWENRDRILAELQEYEERRLQTRCEQRQAKMLRRLNILMRHGPENRAYLYSVWRREDDQDEAFETARREKARRAMAEAAEVELKDLPPIVSFKWEDLREEFEKLVAARKAPASEAEELAENKRRAELEDLDPNSPEGKAYQEKFDAKLKQVEADYRANILPKVQPSPIKRSMGVPPMSNAAGKSARSKDKGTHGPEAHATKKKVGRVVNNRWVGPIPDQDSPEYQKYLDVLPDDAIPQLSKKDRAERAELERRRAGTEARDAARKKTDCA